MCIVQFRNNCCNPVSWFIIKNKHQGNIYYFRLWLISIFLSQRARYFFSMSKFIWLSAHISWAILKFYCNKNVSTCFHILCLKFNRPLRNMIISVWINVYTISNIILKKLTWFGMSHHFNAASIAGHQWGLVTWQCSIIEWIFASSISPTITLVAVDLSSWSHRTNK